MRRRRVILNYDGCTAYQGLREKASAQPSGSTVSKEAFLAHVLAPWLKTHIDALFYSPGTGYLWTTRMESGERFGQYMKGTDAGAILAQCERFWSEDTDDLELLTQAAHQEGLDVFASIPMNDGRFMAEGNEIQWSRLNRDHPEWTLGDPRTPMDYARPEVRSRRLSHVREIADKWDVDGVELDFYRFPSFFSAPASGKAHLMTELLEEAWEVVNEAGTRRGRPVRLAVRTPENQKMSLAIGLDVLEWIRRDLLDILVAGGGHMITDPPVEAFVRATRGSKCTVYACLNHRRPEACTWAWAANADAKCVDGLYLSNWRPGGGEEDAGASVLKEVGKPDNVIGKTKYFCAENQDDGPGRWGSHLCRRHSVPLPIPLSSESASFDILACEEIPATRREPVISLLLTVESDNEGANPVARINGHLLLPRAHPDTPSRNALRLIEAPSGELPATHEIRKPTHELLISPEWLVNGRNRLQVSLTQAGNAPATLTMAGILVDHSTT